MTYHRPYAAYSDAMLADEIDDNRVLQRALRTERKTVKRLRAELAELLAEQGRRGVQDLPF